MSEPDQNWIRTGSLSSISRVRIRPRPAQVQNQENQKLLFLRQEPSWSLATCGLLATSPATCGLLATRQVSCSHSVLFCMFSMLYQSSGCRVWQQAGLVLLRAGPVARVLTGPTRTTRTQINFLLKQTSHFQLHSGSRVTQSSRCAPPEPLALPPQEAGRLTFWAEGRNAASGTSAA